MKVVEMTELGKLTRAIWQTVSGRMAVEGWRSMRGTSCVMVKGPYRLSMRANDSVLQLFVDGGHLKVSHDWSVALGELEQCGYDADALWRWVDELVQIGVENVKKLP